VMKMPDVIKLKEPERCDYIYIDERNKVHLLLPIVGGSEIGLDNTCKTTMEIKNFFFGNISHGVSAVSRLTEYQRLLEEDIQALKDQQVLFKYDDKALIEEKEQRLEQIKQYIELIEKLKHQYDSDGEIEKLRNLYPPLPTGIQNLIRDSENASAVRLSPNLPDMFTRFENPVFSLRRDDNDTIPIIDIDSLNEQPSVGLGYRLRTGLYSPASELAEAEEVPTPINKKSLQAEFETSILDQIAHPEEFVVKGKMTEKKLLQLQEIIQREINKIDPEFKFERTTTGEPINIDYFEFLGLGDQGETLDIWINYFIRATITEDFWEIHKPKDSASVFYDGSQEIKGDNVEAMSIRIQFLLAEANIYCKTNGLSGENFGTFFDKEPHATQLADNIKRGFIEGANIEGIIYEYINKNFAELGLKEPLTSEQQTAITRQFAGHFYTIKNSDHFDEFFIADPDKKGNIFTHQSRMSCHFLDFFERQTKGQCPLGALSEHAAALQSVSSNRLNHKNEIVARGYQELDIFKQDVVRLLAENKPEKLVELLIATSPSGRPNLYSMLSLETQNYIARNRNCQAIKDAIQNSSAPQNIKDDLNRLLTINHVDHENLSSITWSKFSSKPLLQIELSKVAEGLTLTADDYKNKRKKEWFKGFKNKGREKQCEELREIANDINKLLANPSLSRAEVLDKLLKSITTLDKIDKDIANERNLFHSTLKKEVSTCKTRLQEICQLQNYAIKLPKSDQITTLVMEDQFNIIEDSEVQQIVRNLPHHCHTDEAINFFKTLTPAEATNVASYLSLEYREITKSTNKQTLLEQDVPKLFQEVNMRILDEFKSRIDEEVYEKLSKLAGKIPPEHFTFKNIEKWSKNLAELEEGNLDKLLKPSPSTLEKIISFKANFQKILVEPENEPKPVPPRIGR